MKIEEFALERIQSLYENVVPLNLSDSGVHPMSIRDLLNKSQIEELLQLELGYGWTNGEVSLRSTIADLYDDRGPDDVIVPRLGRVACFSYSGLECLDVTGFILGMYRNRDEQRRHERQ